MEAVTEDLAKNVLKDAALQAAEDAAKDAAVQAAKDAAEKAAEAAAEKAAEAAAEKAAEAAAEKAAEAAAEAAAEKAAEDAAKKSALTSLKTLGTKVGKDVLMGALVAGGLAVAGATALLALSQTDVNRINGETFKINSITNGNSGKILITYSPSENICTNSTIVITGTNQPLLDGKTLTVTNGKSTTNIEVALSTPLPTSISTGNMTCQTTLSIQTSCNLQNDVNSVGNTASTLGNIASAIQNGISWVLNNLQTVIIIVVLLLASPIFLPMIIRLIFGLFRTVVSDGAKKKYRKR